MAISSSSTSDGLPRRAVFLSYAREDTPAAQRIADALRSQGLEIWFDQSELRGGDSWDQKIRKQIKECALFMPVISERTQARGEGYFRLEWKLAVERTHLMAEGVPFLAPVVVDHTVETAALVPAEFLRVQWTRLPSGLPTPQFVEQVGRMLENPGAAPAPHRPAGQTMGIPKSRNLLWSACAVLAVLVAIAGTLVFTRRPQTTEAAAVSALAPAVAAPVQAVDGKSIAVLPFDNMSEDKENQFFTDGVHEDVLTNLAFIKDLHVVSRTSVMQYRGTTKSIKTIGQELGVAYVLEGSVRREGNKVRVTGQLINARTDEHLWAKAYDRDLNDIFAIQGELAQAIANALQAVLDPQTKGLLQRRPTENTLAYDEYLKAREFRNILLPGSDKKAATLLESAVQLDPNFAQAWGLLGDIRAFIYFSGETTQAQLKLAKDAIDTAVKLAPDDPDVTECLGDYYYYAFRDYPRATEQYMRLALIRPNDPAIYFSLGLIQRRQGRFADAVTNLRKSVVLDPANRSYVTSLIDTLGALRHFEEVMALGREILAQEPDNIVMAWGMALCVYAKDGSTAEFKAFAQKKFSPSNQGFFLYAQKNNAGSSGNWPEYIRLDTLQPTFESAPEDPTAVQDVDAGEIYAEMGNTALARSRAAKGLASINDLLVQQSDNAVLWSEKGLAHALLGERDEAEAAISKARELLPESRDAIVGRNVALSNAYSLAWLGDKDQALAELQRLLRVPYGANVYSLRVSFKPLQDDPRFKAMVADPANNAPLN